MHLFITNRTAPTLSTLTPTPPSKEHSTPKDICDQVRLDSTSATFLGLIYVLFPKGRKMEGKEMLRLRR